VIGMNLPRLSDPVDAPIDLPYERDQFTQAHGMILTSRPSGLTAQMSRALRRQDRTDYVARRLHLLVMPRS
jgi:hypothetical protein